MSGRRPFLLLGVAVAVWVSIGIPVRATYGAQLTADEPQYVLTAISLAEDLDVDIADELADERWRDFHSPARLPVQTKVLDGGRRVSPHDPLLPALLAVPVALGGWVGAKLALAAMAGALAALVAWVAVHRLGVDRRAALAGTAVFAAAPPLAVYATQVYPEVPAALAVTGALAVVTAARPDARVVAALVTALPWLSVKYAPVAAAIALVGYVRTPDRRRLVALLVVSGVAFAVGHRLLYGGWTPYATGDHFTAGEASVMGFDPDHVGRSRRLSGLLFDRDFGLVPWQPACLLLLPAVGVALRRRPSHTWAILVPLAAGWLVATYAALTMHGWWWPGRQVVVVLPLAVLLVLRHTPPNAALALGSVGVVTFAWLVLDDVTWVVDFADTSNPLYRLWRPLLPDGTSSSAGAIARHVLWTTVAIGAVALAARRPARQPQEVLL